MKFFALIAGLVLLAVSPVLAQTAPVPPIDPVKLRLAKDLVDASGGQQQATAQVDAMYGAMFPKMAENMPKEARSSMLAMQRVMQKEMHALIPQLLDISIRVYASNYTEKELRDLLAFRLSPSGQSTLSKASAVQQQALAEFMPVIFTAMPKVMRAVTDELCSEQKCSPELRNTIQTAMDRALSPYTAPAGKQENSGPTAS